MGGTVIAAPLALVCLLGIVTLFGRRLSEPVTGALVQFATLLGLVASLGMLLYMLAYGPRHLPVELGNWIALPHFHFHLKFVFDRLSIPLVILSFLLCGVVGAFASRYLHREPGYNRFFMLYALFVLGMVVASLADTIETLFAGWELVGISSALLVAFFHERPAPVQNGLRIWAVYRISDAALLLAAVLLHHLQGEGDFDALLGGRPWPYGVAAIAPDQALFVGLLLLVAAAGKSGLVPFSGWLPRAMEGPTPSSAVFYGSLSVHLGAYLLLRVSPLLDLSPLLSLAVLTLGLATAALSALATRVQTDVKSSLAFASLTQVGIIVAEIGVAGLLPAGWDTALRYFALAHIIGHACLRTLQLLRASSLLQDYRMLENAIGGRLSHSDAALPLASPASSPWLYRFALERGYLDAFLSDYIARPILRLFRGCDRWERRWTDWLSGGPSRASDKVESSGRLLEDLT
jgi:NAD(P)H-quinone oxidoreductase subunit 5